jgi:hypothetical protein
MIGATQRESPTTRSDRSRRFVADAGERSKRFGEPGAVRADGLEKGSISVVDDVRSLPGELAASRSRSQDTRACVGRMRHAAYELAPLESANDLRGHHRVGPGVAGDASLGERRVVFGEGGDTGEEDELYRRQSKWGEGGALALLPAVGSLPEAKARALAGRCEEAWKSFRHGRALLVSRQVFG